MVATLLKNKNRCKECAHFLTTINQVCVFRLILQFSSNASNGSMFNNTTDVSYIIYFYTAALVLAKIWNII